MTGTEDFPETVRTLRDDVDEGLFTRGAQVSLVRGGRPVLDVAVGDDGGGRPMTTATVMRVYCTIKPITAMAIGRLVDAGTITLETPMRDVLPGPAAFDDGEVELRHVLDHTAGVHEPMAIAVELLAPDRRADAADRIGRPPGWVVGRDAAYSEWYGWSLLGRAIETVTGDDLRRHLRSEVLDPLGLDATWIGMTAEEHREVVSRLGTNLDMRTDRAFPLILERGERMCTETNPAHGGYTTAADLARFYAAVLAARSGDDVAGLPRPETVRTMTSPQRPRVHDRVLDRECTFGYGVMTELADHAFGRECPPSSFGHSGNVGSTFAFADPERDLAVAVVFNGLVDHESAFLRRPALVRAIYRDLAALDGPDDGSDERDLEPDRGRGRRRWRRG